MTAFYFNMPKAYAKAHPGKTAAECFVHQTADHRVVRVPSPFADQDAALIECLKTPLAASKGKNGLWLEVELGSDDAERRFGERVLRALASKSRRFASVTFQYLPHQSLVKQETWGRRD